MRLLLAAEIHFLKHHQHSFVYIRLLVQYQPWCCMLHVSLKDDIGLYIA
jgi:hypothetical protein